MKKRCGMLVILLLLSAGLAGCGDDGNASREDAGGAATLYVVQNSENVDLNVLMEKRMYELTDISTYEIRMTGDVDYTRTGIYSMSADIERPCYTERINERHGIQIAVISAEEAQNLGEEYIIYTSNNQRWGESVADSEPDIAASGEGIGDAVSVGNEPDQAEADSSELDNIESVSDEPAALGEEDFTEYFTFYNYNIGYSPEYINAYPSISGDLYRCQMTLAPETALSEQSKFNVYYYSEEELSWISPGRLETISDESDIERSKELCELVAVHMVIGDLYTAFAPSDITREVTSSELVNVNDIDMLRETGTFYNSGKGTAHEYVAYYFAVKQNSQLYPAFAMGILTEGTLENVEKYMDEAVKHMSKAE